MFGKLSYAASAFLLVSSALPALSAPVAADSLLSLAKRIVIPACSGDPNTPKPAFCQQFNHPTKFGGPVPFKREEAAWELAKRIIIPACSGDPSTPKPAFCQQFNHPIKLGGPVEFKREEGSAELAKRFVLCDRSLANLNLNSEGCTPVGGGLFGGPEIFRREGAMEFEKRFAVCDRSLTSLSNLNSQGCTPLGINGLFGGGSKIFRREDSLFELAKRIVIPACSGDPNTPKPAFCSTLSNQFPSSINGHQILALRDNIMESLTKRFAPICTGDASTPKPAFCSRLGHGPVVNNGPLSSINLNTPLFQGST